LPARASSVTNSPIASIELASRVELVPAACRPLLFTTMSKLQIGKGLVRISAGMVGILLDSCSSRQLEWHTPRYRACGEGTTTSVRMTCGDGESESLKEDTVRRSCKERRITHFGKGGELGAN